MTTSSHLSNTIRACLNGELPTLPEHIAQGLAALANAVPQTQVRIHDYVWPQREEHKDDCIYACNYSPAQHLERGELLAVVHPRQINGYLQRDDDPNVSGDAHAVRARHDGALDDVDRGLLQAIAAMLASEEAMLADAVREAGGFPAQPGEAEDAADTFELWWADYLPEATRDHAWSAWRAVSRASGAGGTPAAGGLGDRT